MSVLALCILSSIHINCIIFIAVYYSHKVCVCMWQLAIGTNSHIYWRNEAKEEEENRKLNLLVNDCFSGSFSHFQMDEIRSELAIRKKINYEKENIEMIH